MKSQFWKKTWFAVVMVVVFPIAGIIFTWNAGMKKNTKIVTTVIACFYMLWVYPRFFLPTPLNDDPPLQRIVDSIVIDEDLKTSGENLIDAASSFADALF